MSLGAVAALLIGIAMLVLPAWLAAGIQHVGEVDHLHGPTVGEVIEIMYAPDDPSSSDTVAGGSVVGRIINYGAVFILLGGGGIFVILASLGLISA